MAGTPEAYEVLATNPKGHAKAVRLRCGRNRTTLLLHRFALVGKGDLLRFEDGGTSKVFVEPPDADNPPVPVAPVFTTADRVTIGREGFAVRVRELNHSKDLDALQFLEQFHYKTNRSLGEPETGNSDEAKTASIGGRRAVLYAEIKLGARWEPAGYVDLQMPLMMCKPRHVLFQRPYSHPTRRISWESWDQHSMKLNLNSDSPHSARRGNARVERSRPHTMHREGGKGFCERALAHPRSPSGIHGNFGRNAESRRLHIVVGVHVRGTHRRQHGPRR